MYWSVVEPQHLRWSLNPVIWTSNKKSLILWAWKVMEIVACVRHLENFFSIWLKCLISPVDHEMTICSDWGVVEIANATLDWHLIKHLNDCCSWLIGHKLNSCNVSIKTEQVEQLEDIRLVEFDASDNHHIRFTLKSCCEVYRRLILVRCIRRILGSEVLRIFLLLVTAINSKVHRVIPALVNIVHRYNQLSCPSELNLESVAA